jgi:flagellar hook-associated protein 2
MASIRKTTDDTTSTLNNMMGLSGLDTSTMLKTMMSAYKKPIALAKQKQQIVIWKQERYREIISKVQDFQSKYFDYMNPSTNLLSASNFKRLTIDNATNDYVKIKTTSGTLQGAGKIEIKALPTAASVQGRSGITTEIVGTSAPDYSGASSAGYVLNLDMDGVTRGIYLGGINNVTDLQDAINLAFGVNKIKVEEVPRTLSNGTTTNVLKFTAGENVNQISVVDVSSVTNAGRFLMGFDGSLGNLSNRVDTNVTLDNLQYRLDQAIVPSGQQTVTFTINNKTFEFDKNTKLSKVMETINDDETAGVTITYDSSTDSFKIENDDCGAGGTFLLRDDSGNFLNALGLIPPAAGTVSVGGVIDAGFVADANAQITAGTPYSINVTVDGVTKTFTMNNGTAGGGLYVDENDMLAQIDDWLNNATTGAFKDKGVKVGVQAPVAPATGWNLTLEIDPAAANPAKYVTIGAGAGMSDADWEALSKKMGVSELPQWGFTDGAFGSVVIDGVIRAVDSKVFEYNGLSYELLQVTEPGKPVNYEVNVDADAMVETIKGFVEAYNELLTVLNNALSEERDYDYQPLTDEQRDEMEEADIERWEAKAKTGILRGDSNLIALQRKLRSALFSSVQTSYGYGATANEYLPMTMSKLGINTSDDYKDFGKIQFSEDKFRAAVAENVDLVARFFAKPSEAYVDDPTLTAEQNAARAADAKLTRQRSDATAGIAIKLQSIINDYVRTTRDSAGLKGLLIEKAGLENDLSALTSAFSKEIIEYDTKIDSLWDRYDRIEAEKLALLSRLESYVSNQSSVAEWLSNQTSS